MNILYFNRKRNGEKLTKNEKKKRIKQLKKQYGDNNRFIAVEKWLAELYRG